MGRAHSSEKRRTLSPVNAALVEPRQGGQMTSYQSQGATGLNRHKTWYLEVPETSMSSSGHQSFDMKREDRSSSTYFRGIKNVSCSKF
ncbi:jg8975 [Pararge aegeria aegeria]|uniref:Jg8975 protein n=1 Tax=Pararge aegeria aegeria TaxID=348720 RepID=A0A8S4R1V7_9NEOP|nr:jg8975 [Pararge aegeria aegeria]